MTGPLRVAVVGAGPAGCYVADALCYEVDRDVRLDIFDRLPTPFGLLRYGVAPDHLKMKSLQRTLQRTLDDPRVRFLGNVQIGTDLNIRDLLESYHAVVYAQGASRDNQLGIPGECLPDSRSATEFVAWYTGHPDSVPSAFSLTASAVAVVGLGNVAVDVTRMLLKDVDLLRGTDIPTPVLEVLADSKVSDVHMLGRRGPAQARWTPKELRELGELPGVDVVVDPADLVLDEASQTAVDADASLGRCLAVLREWAERRPSGAARTLHVHFFVKPVAITGISTVEGLRVERCRLNGNGLLSEGDVDLLEVQMVLKSIGYLGIPMSGVPFDEQQAIIPSVGSRVVRDGRGNLGEYVCGWIGRGARGVLGTNKGDAEDCVKALLTDAPQLLARSIDPRRIDVLLADRGIEVVDLVGWARIEVAESALGRAEGRPRAKIATLDGLLAAAATRADSEMK